MGLEVTGEALIQARIADAGDVPFTPPPSWPGVTPGPGQLVPAATAALLGRAVLPSGGQSVHCQSGLVGSFRTNIGLLNPTTQPTSLEIRGIAYLSYELEPLFMASALPKLVPGHVTLAPLEWMQLNDVVPQLGFVQPDVRGMRPCELGDVFAFNVMPADNEAPYHAHVSAVYSDRNDPELIPAVPGQLPEGPEGWIPRE